MTDTQVNVVISAKDLASLQLKAAENSTKKFTKSLKRLAITAAAGAGLFAIGKGLKSIISATSDAQEIGSKFEAVFKDQTDAAREFVKITSEALGRSKIELESYMGTLQDTFVPLGFVRDKARDMSQQLTTLAIDLASFNNKADAEVIRDLQSAIVGNVETMRKYGVIINQAVLNQELLNMGIEGGVRNATEQEKAQARLNLILAGTKDAQGDAARTSESYANQVKKLKAQIRDLSAEIGDKLLPILSETINKFTSLSSTTKLVTASILSFTIATGGFLVILPDLIEGIGVVSTGFVLFRKNLAKMVIVQRITKSLVGLKVAITGVVGAISSIVLIGGAIATITALAGRFAILKYATIKQEKAYKKLNKEAVDFTEKLKKESRERRKNTEARFDQISGGQKIRDLYKWEIHALNVEAEKQGKVAMAMAERRRELLDFISAVEQQYNIFRKTTREIDLHDSELVGLTQTQKNQFKAALKLKDIMDQEIRSNNLVEESIKNLKNQIFELGKTPDEIMIGKLVAEGATQKQIADVEALMNKLKMLRGESNIEGTQKLSLQESRFLTLRKTADPTQRAIEDTAKFTKLMYEEQKKTNKTLSQSQRATGTSIDSNVNNSGSMSLNLAAI